MCNQPSKIAYKLTELLKNELKFRIYIVDGVGIKIHSTRSKKRKSFTRKVRSGNNKKHCKNKKDLDIKRLNEKKKHDLAQL